ASGGTLDHGIQNGLGYYYVCLAIMNAVYLAYHQKVSRDRSQSGLGATFTAVFLIHALVNFIHLGWVIPNAAKDLVDWLMGPVTYFVLSVVAFTLFLIYRKFFTRPDVAWTVLNLGMLFSGWAMTNQDFRLIITKEDNVPIVILILSVAFFTWLAMRK